MQIDPDWTNAMSVYSKIVKQVNGNGGLIRLLAYPLTLLAWAPWRLWRTLLNARVLAQGKWAEYNRFRVKQGINSLFYWTQAEHIDLYGRFGISPNIGLGDYPLRKWFQLTLSSLYAYRYAGAVLPLASMLVWWASFFLWFGDVGPVGVWPLIVLLLALISTTFYAGAFVFLNYNALGWAFLPLGLWGLSVGNYWITAFAWLGAGFTSITVLLVAGILTFTYAIQGAALAPLATLVPAGLKMLTHFQVSRERSGTSEDLLSNLKLVAAGIGLLGSHAKYKRKPLRRKLSILFFYFLMLYALFGFAIIYTTGTQPWLWWSAVTLYLINRLLARFADDQSLHMTVFTVATVSAIEAAEPLTAAAYWLVASPLPRLLGDGSLDEPIDRPPPLAPFHVRGIIERIGAFLSPVAAGQRVLMAYDDPQGHYERLFDGYRSILEVPSFVAAHKQVHFFPDWHAVFQTNYEGAPNIWGRSCSQVMENVARWSADFVVVYQENDTDLEDQWAEHGFSVAGHLQWADCAEELRNEKPWVGPAPQWWLLKVPHRVGQAAN